MAKISLLLIGISVIMGAFPHTPAATSSNPMGTTIHPLANFMAPPGTPNATVEVRPGATIDVARTMKQITIELYLNNTPDVPPFNGISVQIAYDPHVLQSYVIKNGVAVFPGNLTYSSNVFAQSGYTTQLLRDCLDGHAADLGPSSLCGSEDGPGVVSFAETILGQSTADGTAGDIFFLTLVANTTLPAFSQIRIVQVVLGNGQQNILTTNLDGYYTSQNCGGLPCQPGVAKFTWFPQPAKQGQIVTFYANASLPSTNAVITNYTWFFNDPQAIRSQRDTGKNSTATWVYQLAGRYSVTLSVLDSNGLKVSTTNQVRVINANVDMGIDSIAVQPGYSGLHAGVVFTITAVLKNYGGLPENTTLTITLAAGNKVLNTTSVTNMRPSSSLSLKARWDSAGYASSVYRIDASTPLVVNESSTDQYPNERSYWVQLVSLQPGGGLSLLSTAGLSVLVLGAGGAGVSFIRKRARRVDDSL